VQAKVLEQVEGPEFVVADTMDLWIETAKDELLALMQRHRRESCSTTRRRSS
jgi:hypothetical protein